MPSAQSLGLAHPFPIPLSKPAIKSNFGFYCYSADDRFCFHNFHSAYAAKHFLNTLIDGAEYKWLNNNELLTEKGLRIRGENRKDLEQAIEHELTTKEAEWDIPEPYLTYYRQFIGRKRLIEPETVIEPAKVTRTPRSSPTPAARIKVAKAKVKAGEHITISEICAELGHPPRVCRAILRELKVPKPEHGWAWSKSEADKIRSRLKQRLR